MYQSWFKKSERPVQHHVNCGYFSKETSIRNNNTNNKNKKASTSPQRAKYIDKYKNRLIFQLTQTICKFKIM